MDITDNLVNLSPLSRRLLETYFYQEKGFCHKEENTYWHGRRGLQTEKNFTNTLKNSFTSIQMMLFKASRCYQIKICIFNQNFYEAGIINWPGKNKFYILLLSAVLGSIRKSCFYPNNQWFKQNSRTPFSPCSENCNRSHQRNIFKHDSKAPIHQCQSASFRQVIYLVSARI